MFFFKKDGDEEMPDPSNLSAIELAKLMDKNMSENDLHELTELEITDDQYRKVVNMIEQFVGAGGFDKESLLAFKKGMMYGIGLGYKVSDKASEFKKKPSEEELQALMRKFAFPFMSIDKGIERWEDDHWFDSMLANAKIAEPTTKTKRKDK